MSTLIYHELSFYDNWNCEFDNLNAVFFFVCFIELATSSIDWSYRLSIKKTKMAIIIGIKTICHIMLSILHCNKFCIEDWNVKRTKYFSTVNKYFLTGYCYKIICWRKLQIKKVYSCKELSTLSLHSRRSIKLTNITVIRRTLYCFYCFELS